VIDLDRAQDECGWDGVVVIHREPIRFRHPRETVPEPGRRGLLPRLASWFGGVRTLLVGDTQVETIRGRLIERLEPMDRDGLATLRRLRGWDLFIVHRTLLSVDAAYAAAIANAALAALVAGRGRKAVDAAPVEHVPAENGGAGSYRFTAENPRLPGFMGGGLWGKALAESAGGAPINAQENKESSHV